MKGEKYQDKGKEQPWEKGESGNVGCTKSQEKLTEREESREGKGRPAEREGRGKGRRGEIGGEKQWWNLA